MNDKELGEIRRRWKPDKNSIGKIHGCYVNEKREIISSFDLSLGMMSEEESDMYLALFRRTLSGGLGKNLMDINFATSQVGNSEEHNLLMALRNSDLKDETAVQSLYEQIIGSLTLEGQYVILLAGDTYDVPFRGRDGAGLEDASSEVFSYFLCSICPVKRTKPSLSYDFPEQAFHNSAGHWVVSSPELGFLFPCFDDRSTNIYNALYYSRNNDDSHEDFVNAIFRTDTPVPPTVQKETFQSILSDTLEESCSLEVVQSVHEQLSGMIEAHKVNKDPEPLLISRQEVAKVLELSGVSEEHLISFEEKYDEAFGPGLTVSPKNLVNTRQFELRTPDVVIKVNPERSDLIETRTINGCKYILISADAGVEVNGVQVQVADGSLPLTEEHASSTEENTPSIEENVPSTEESTPSTEE